MLDYFPFYYDTIESVDELSDEDAGKLLKALLHSGVSAEAEKPAGESRFLFMELRRRAIKASEAFDNRSATSRANGKLGGRPSKKKEVPVDNQEVGVGSDDNHEVISENLKNLPVISETQKTHKEKEKEIKEIIKEKTSGFDFLDIDPAEALKQQRLIDNVIEAAERAKFDGGEVMFEKLQMLCAEYSPEWVLSAIDSAVEHGVPKLVYIRSVLEGYRRNGGPNDKQQQSDDMWGGAKDLF